MAKISLKNSFMPLSRIQSYLVVSSSQIQLRKPGGACQFIQPSRGERNCMITPQGKKATCLWNGGSTYLEHLQQARDCGALTFFAALKQCFSARRRVVALPDVGKFSTPLQRFTRRCKIQPTRPAGPWKKLKQHIRKKMKQHIVQIHSIVQAPNNKLVHTMQIKLK